MQPGLKLAVTTPSGRVLARADALAQLTGAGFRDARCSRGCTGASSTGRARGLCWNPRPRSTTVITRRSSAKLEVTQTANRWIRLRDHALMRMLNFSLSTSAVAVSLMFAFAAWLALRLSAAAPGE